MQRRGWRLQDADAEDVVQAVLLKLAHKLRTFTHDPSQSFRGWLQTLSHHAQQDFLDSRARPGRGSGSPKTFERLETVEARDDLMRRLEEEFDCELLDLAMARVRLRVAPHT